MDFSLDELAPERGGKVPSFMENVLYLFFSNGIGIKEFEESPIPYILSMMSTFSYIKKEEEKAYKKASRK